MVDGRDLEVLVSQAVSAEHLAEAQAQWSDPAPLTAESLRKAIGKLLEPREPTPWVPVIHPQEYADALAYHGFPPEHRLTVDEWTAYMLGAPPRH